MLNEQTLERLRSLRLTGMYHLLKTSLDTDRTTTLTPDEWLHQLVEAEWDERQNRSIEQRIRLARFRYRASLEELHYAEHRGLNRLQVERLAACDFIDRGEPILITGSTGSGKSYLASALGYHACARGYRVIYHHMPKLISKLKMSKADGSYIKEVARIERQQLLIVDDFGLQPLDAATRTALLELIEDRHGKSALIITSQVPVSGWHAIIGEQTIADAILDRIVHAAHRIELKGESMRKKRMTPAPETSSKFE